jgi:hypothetical protein
VGRVHDSLHSSCDYAICLVEDGRKYVSISASILQLSPWFDLCMHGLLQLVQYATLYKEDNASIGRNA